MRYTDETEVSLDILEESDDRDELIVSLREYIVQLESMVDECTRRAGEAALRTAAMQNARRRSSASWQQ